MKHRLAYNIFLIILLLCSMVAWFLAGFSVGIQTVPNPVAQRELNIATAVIILSIIGLILVNTVGRRKPVSTSTGVKTIKPQSK